MDTNTTDLTSFYTEQYLTHDKPLVSESTEAPPSVVQEKKFIKNKAMKKGKSNSKERTHSDISDDEVGAVTYNDSTNFSSHFDKLLREFGDDTFGDEDGTVGDDSEFGEGEDYDYESEDGDEQISVSRSVLQSIVDQLQGLLGDETGDDAFAGGEDEFGGEGDIDDVPVESYTNGAQGNYDGKAKTQGKSSLVKGNGDAEFGKQDTGFAPEDTEGSEGSEHGDQGEYDGKAKTQGKTNLVQANGNANVGKTQKTGYGKQEKQRLF